MKTRTKSHLLKQKKPRCGLVTQKPEVRVDACVQASAAAGRGVRGLHAGDGGESHREEESDLGDHLGWEGRTCAQVPEISSNTMQCHIKIVFFIAFKRDSVVAWRLREPALYRGIRSCFD